ncbi:MAG TPA: UDP-2,3-diacylglucosamine diphosphatase LpxI, partial [Caulobacteraceae bacterium]|nr:UDP-2,3-diacylglucosamine diphosphatase LpxI [Caulobacteraceae bacterium]
RRGVLAKVAKPIQEDRVDMPTIGVATVEAAARAGLAGIVGVAGRMLVLDREAVAHAADACGVFVVGVADAPV